MLQGSYLHILSMGHRFGRFQFKERDNFSAATVLLIVCQTQMKMDSIKILFYFFLIKEYIDNESIKSGTWGAQT